MQWYAKFKQAAIADTDLVRLEEELKGTLEDVKAALPHKSGQNEESAWDYAKFHQVRRFS